MNKLQPSNKINADFGKIKEILSKNYDLKNIKKISVIPHTDINSLNYLIQTKKEKFVLHNFKDDSQPEKLEKICLILNHCKKHGCHVTYPVKNNRKLYVNKKHRIYLTKFQPGEIYNKTNYQLSTFAESLSILHQTLAGIPFDYMYKTNQSFYKILTIDDLKKIRNLIVSKPNKNNFDKKFLQNFLLIKKSINFIKSLPQKGKFKKQLIHHDLHPHNVIFYKNSVGAILDFHSLRKGMVMQDVSFAAFRFAEYKNNNIKNLIKKIVYFLEKYNENNSLSYDEIIHFNIFLELEILSRLSYILKKNYFTNSFRWNVDLDKFLKFLHLINLIKPKIELEIRRINKNE